MWVLCLIPEFPCFTHSIHEKLMLMYNFPWRNMYCQTGILQKNMIFVLQNFSTNDFKPNSSKRWFSFNFHSSRTSIYFKWVYSNFCSTFKNETIFNKFGSLDQSSVILPMFSIGNKTKTLPLYFILTPIDTHSWDVSYFHLQDNIFTGNRGTRFSISPAMVSTFPKV